MSVRAAVFCQCAFVTGGSSSTMPFPLPNVVWRVTPLDSVDVVPTSVTSMPDARVASVANARYAFVVSVVVSILLVSVSFVTRSVTFA